MLAAWLKRVAALVLLAALMLAGGAGTAQAAARRAAPAPAAARTPVVSFKAPRAVLATDHTVQFIYFVPADRTISPVYAAAIRAAAVRMAGWYSEQLEGRRMRMSPAGLVVCRGEQPADFYSTESYTRVLAAVNRCFPQVGFNDPAHLWVIYADARHACNDPDRMGAGASSTTIMPIQDLQGLAGETSIVNDCGDVNTMAGPEWVTRWIGGLAHEFGHSAGLPHPPGCEEKTRACENDALMWAGYAQWPRTYLRDAEKQHLIDSGFFTPL